jgi:hypothetical protein
MVILGFVLLFGSFELLFVLRGGALHHGSRTFLGVRAVRSPFLRDDLRCRPSVGSRDLRVGARLTVASL